MPTHAKRMVTLSIVLAMLFSAIGTAAADEFPEPEDQIIAAETEDFQETQEAEQVQPDDSVDQIEPDPQPIELAPETEDSQETQEAEQVQPDDSVDQIEPDSEPIELAAETGYPTQQEAYNSMIALKKDYPEGLYWTNFAPYGRDGDKDKGAYYKWKGGKLAGNVNGGVGCAAFAFILSDEAFGNLPGRMIYSPAFTYEDIKVGDILRVNNNSHFVIVLQKSAGGIIVAEGNYNKSVHWGRAMSKADVMNSTFIVTRYPVNYIEDDTADDEVVKNKPEGGLSWTLTRGGTLTISGSGAMTNYSPNDIMPSWYDYRASINTIIVKDGVTSIGDYAFYESNALSVYLPNGITKIGSNAFQKSQIVSVTVPSTVITIGDDAFRKCVNLTSVSISEGLTTIGQRAFHSCTSLQYIDFPASVTEVEAGAFTSCSAMVRARFAPSTQTVKVGDDLFTQCWHLSDLTLPLKIDRISDRMFSSCSSLTSIYIPADVREIGMNPFISTPMQEGGASTISFGGTEAAWIALGGQLILNAMPNAKIFYNVPFVNPFEKDLNDPGDLVTEEQVDPGSHTHNWSAVYDKDADHHWRNCSAEGCTVTDNSKKDGYAEHDYGDWMIDVSATAAQSGSKHRDCAVCAYRQIDSIPATGGSSSAGNPSSGPISPGYSGEMFFNAPTQIPDGSTTTVVTDTATGIKTETTKKPDGSSIVTTTQKDGTVTIATTDTNGKAGVAVKLPTSVVNAGEQRGEPVALPIPAVQVTRDVMAASPITVQSEKGGTVEVAIPVASPTVGTVAMIVNADGSTSVVKTSVPTSSSVVASLSNGSTVKIVDNSRTFADVPDGAWYGDAVAFVSARELFSGTTAATFAPETPMTRAMLMTVLARFDGAETAGGATWYEKGMEWAVQHGVSDGSNPNDRITREQLVTMLWRYLGAATAADGLSDYTDADQISGYAQEAMRWAVKNGIVSGFGDSRLDPQGQATRSQVSQMLMDLIKNITLSPAA